MPRTNQRLATTTVGPLSVQRVKEREMSSRKPSLDQTLDQKSVQDDLNAESSSSEHQLVTRLRTILADPTQHTVGALAAAVEGGLAELSFLKDRLDLIAMNSASDDGAFSEPSSGSTAAPGMSKRA